jgi:hypothetical protein
MAIQRHHFELFANYHQFYLQDEQADGNLGDSWTPEATARLLAVAPGTIGVGTVRNMTVPVDVEILDGPPEATLDEWDQVNECSIEVFSGRIVIAGCTDYFPNAARLIVTPGTYRAAVFYGKLDTLSDDGLEGEDYYCIVLWPGEAIAARVLKPRSTVCG